jgi:hypothetical protein
MADPIEEIEDAGWQVTVDDGAGEVRLDHADTGSAYVLGPEGGLRVPGEGNVETALHDLQGTVASALDGDGGRPSGGLVESGVEVDSSGIERDDATDAVTIESETRVSLRAPIVEVSGIDPVEISSPGRVDISGGGPDLRVAVPGGPQYALAPVEGDLPVSEYYGFDTETQDSAALLDELSIADATVTFVYRDRGTGTHSLVFVHDDPASETGGAAVLTVAGADESEWLVQDGPPGNDAYETPDGSFDGPESAAWSWPGDVTDGGAVGPLGEAFDIDMTHLATGTVNGTTTERDGIDRWLFLDGRDPGSPIEIATFGDGESADITVRVFTGG